MDETSPTPSRSPDELLWERHNPDVKLLLRRNMGFIVFLDEDLEVDWETTPEHDKFLDAHKVDPGKIQGRITCLEAVPIDRLAESTKRSFRSMVGEAMCVALDGDMKGVQSLLATAEAFVNARNHEQARCWYVWASAWAAVILAFLTWVVAFIYSRFHPGSPYAKANILTAGVCGAIGALLSILLRVGRAPLDPAAGMAVHRLEGAARIAVGVIAAVIVICAIRTKLVLPQLQNPYGIALACLVAGASERLASGIIERVETALSKTENKGSEKKS